ncbi:MAG: ligand-binding sensor domain-containing protein [Planctomycetota bacterium]|jgi:ligand-binding sensor domain-containing protein
MNRRHHSKLVGHARPITATLFSASLFLVGCTVQEEPRQPVAELAPSTATIVAVPAQMGSVVRCVLEDTRGKLWIGGEDLYCHDGASLTCYDVRDDLGRGVTIKAIVEDSKGVLWCGTTGGITKIDGDHFSSFGEQHGLISRDVWSLAMDGEGVLWIGTIDGVCRFDGSTFTPFALPEAEPDLTRGITSRRIVHCIMVDRRERVWFGTNGGAYIYDGSALSNISEQDGLSNDAVHRLLEDRSGNVWFGTTHGGICRFDGEAFSNFTEQGLVEGTEVWCMHEDRSGNVWFSGKQFGAYRYDGKAFTNFDEQQGLATPGLMSILEDGQGRLWLGGVKGLFRFDGESFVRVTSSGPWH